LPGASGLALLLCDSTWQVAPPVTSNPKSVQNNQCSSLVSCIWVREIQVEVSAAKSLPKPERQQQAVRVQ